MRTPGMSTPVQCTVRMRTTRTCARARPVQLRRRAGAGAAAAVRQPAAAACSSCSSCCSCFFTRAEEKGVPQEMEIPKPELSGATKPRRRRARRRRAVDVGMGTCWLAWVVRSAYGRQDDVWKAAGSGVQSTQPRIVKRSRSNTHRTFRMRSKSSQGNQGTISARGHNTAIACVSLAAGECATATT